MAVKFNYRYDAVFKYIQVEILVWRVDSIAFEAEAHKNSFHAEHLFESRDNRDTTATASSDRFFTKAYFESGFGSLIRRQINRA